VGGDEFALLLTGFYSEDRAIELAERAVAAIAEPFVVEDWRESLTCSIGIAHADAESSATEVINHADQAMHSAKANGGRRWALFDAELGDALRERALLAADLRDAVHSDPLLPFYQPLLQIQTGQLIRFAVLAPWPRRAHALWPR